MFRSRSWFGGGWNRPKNRLSLDHLKYLYSVLERNTTVSESNRGLLVESLRSIAEILIWGDQNDSSVFDFFLEKNMLSYFLHIMRQKSGGSSFVCVQLLQTLNILFENIRNETSLYYLLSNNLVNSIIVHKFDFSDEDVMGYYILFLKTLSLKLNTHTIHFFYNEHTNDFPLYTEAIKFFNHPESMVRIAVRTITLNVYRVQNPNMLQFIRDKTAAPYFSNLVWFIGKHILELDACVRNDIDHQSQHRLANLVAEHLDHLHYLNDILCLDIADLNAVLTEHLLHKLFVPLYIFSLTPSPPISMAVVTRNLAAVLNKVVDIDIKEMNNPRVASVVALFLLSLVFLVITHRPLINALTWVILNADHTVFKEGAAQVLNAYIDNREVVALGFGQPVESLEEALESTVATGSSYGAEHAGDETNPKSPKSSSSSSGNSGNSSNSSSSANNEPPVSNSPSPPTLSEEIEKVNITDEEKEKLLLNAYRTPETNRPFLDMVLSSLECVENDYHALLALCLLYALANNKGVNSEWLEIVLNRSSPVNRTQYNVILIEKLLQIVNISSQPSCRIRLVTTELGLKLLAQIIGAGEDSSAVPEEYRLALNQARNQAMNVLKNFYKSEDIFLDLFEDEYNEMLKSTLNVEFLCNDSAILLPPTGTPLTGISFTRRLPCGEVEKARRAIRVFFLLRRMCQTITDERETLLPLTNSAQCVQLDNALDLNNSDLIACTVVMRDGTKYRRFLVMDILQLILVEPDSKRLGWGVAKFVGFLQDVEVNGDKEDSRSLHLTIHRGGATNNRTPILSAKFLFDDHIRCMAAKQRLTKGRSKARQKKMFQIAQLLEIPGQLSESAFPSLTGGATAGPGLRHGGSGRRQTGEHRPLFSTSNRVPGVAAALRRDSMPSGSVVSRVQISASRSTEGEPTGARRKLVVSGAARRESSQPIGVSSSAMKSRECSRNRSGTPRSRESSPRIPRPRSEEIPLEDFRRSQNSSPVSRGSSNNASRAHTPSRLTMEPLSVATVSGSGGGGLGITNANGSGNILTVTLKDQQIPISFPVASAAAGVSGATAPATGSTALPTSTAVPPEELSPTSEETSFIANEERQKKRGVVETV
ncbi:protein CLEC16A homolog isoform X1 [Anopheles bellator]|uniref:protein CLEC16A homolog isoform X1 n=1 Tax=Anopheles bellator TaxID=139047 RepID=UPI002648A940|nr:protein CLEC16A homolog isoform X1 [Anopheles bellator]